jgi:hypothetical protein
MSSEVLSPTTHRCYYLKSRRVNRIVGIVCLAIAVVEGVLIIAWGQSQWYLVVLMILLGIENLAIAQSTFTTSTEGLKYSYMALYSIRTGWANLDHVDDVKTRFGGKVRHLVLRKPGNISGALAGFSWLSPKSLRGLTILLAPGWANYDDLFKDIKDNAPHIADL